MCSLALTSILTSILCLVMGNATAFASLQNLSSLAAFGVLVVRMDSGTNTNVVLVIRTVPNIVPPTPQHGRGEKNKDGRRHGVKVRSCIFIHEKSCLWVYYEGKEA